jgi:hypothetical protein
MKSKKTKSSGHDAGKKRSAAVKATWTNRKVRAARSARHNVKVGGEQYRSVAQAFIALKLPMASHQRVRRELVLNGKANYEGKRFVLAQAN